ncbi:hypothetical protein MTO96_020201 [Rhipicephalus appendiculatus]
MAHNDLRMLYELLSRLSAAQLRSLNDLDLPWLPRLEYAVPEQLASAICASIYPSHFDSEMEFLQKLAWLFAWLVPHDAFGDAWLLYRRNGPPTPSEDLALHRRFMTLINYPGCRMTHATVACRSGLYTCIITTDPAIRPPQRNSAVCLAVWPGKPFFGFACSGAITIARLYRALYCVLPGIPREQRILTYETFAFMDAFVRNNCLE